MEKHIYQQVRTQLSHTLIHTYILSVYALFMNVSIHVWMIFVARVHHVCIFMYMCMCVNSPFFRAQVRNSKSHTTSLCVACWCVCVCVYVCMCVCVCVCVCVCCAPDLGAAAKLQFSCNCNCKCTSVEPLSLIMVIITFMLMIWYMRTHACSTNMLTHTCMYACSSR